MDLNFSRLICSTSTDSADVIQPLQARQSFSVTVAFVSYSLFFIILGWMQLCDGEMQSSICANFTIPVNMLMSDLLQFQLFLRLFLKLNISVSKLYTDLKFTIYNLALFLFLIREMEMLFAQKLNETSMKKINAIINPPKFDKNQALIKRAITLFYQINPIEDFDPVQQFDIIENIPITKERFCQLTTDVIFKNTKSLFSIKTNFQSLVKGKKDNQKQSKLQHQQDTFQKAQKTEYIIQNEEKIFCEILTKIRFACSRLQQLFYRMIDIHGWKCQSKKNCKRTYLEGHIAKVLFKRLILPYEGFQRQLKALIEQKQLRCENKTDIESLRQEIQKWGKQLFELIGQQKSHQESLDQKSSSQIKYIVCASCYYGKKLPQLSEIFKTTMNNQNQKKKITDTSSHEESRKKSLLSIQNKSTKEKIDEQAKFHEDKTYERLYNFLQDLKIDHNNDNRVELRLNLQQNEDSGENILLKRMKVILYKDYK